MGFSKPKTIQPVAAPPPVTASAPAVARAEEQARRLELDRTGYDSTLDPSRAQKTLLSSENTVRPGKRPQKTLLSAS